MRIVYAIPVRHVEPLAEGNLMALGIETAFAPAPSLPWIVTFPMIVAVAAPPSEAGGDAEHSLSGRVLGPDLQDVVDPMDLVFSIKPGSSTPAGWEWRSAFPFGVRFEANHYGAYSVELAVGASPPYSVHLQVVDPTVPPTST